MQTIIMLLVVVGLGWATTKSAGEFMEVSDDKYQRILSGLPTADGGGSEISVAGGVRT